MTVKLPILVFIISGFISCTNSDHNNPAAEGFNVEASDKEAMEIADKVMVALGGRKKWNNTRYFYWNFFGKRDLLWDKKTGNVRIYSSDDSTLYLMNVNDMTGRMFVKGVEITDAEKLREGLKNGKGMWINDSYWLFMPFKLKDSGVTLKYLGYDTTLDGKPVNVLRLTFEDVGYTPENKYEVYVDTSDYLVKQWAYFKSYEQDSASAIWPWDNYKNYNGLMLSADRSDNKGPRNVKIFDHVPEEAFTDPSMDIGKLTDNH